MFIQAFASGAFFSTHKSAATGYGVQALDGGYYGSPGALVCWGAAGLMLALLDAGCCCTAAPLHAARGPTNTRCTPNRHPTRSAHPHAVPEPPALALALALAQPLAQPQP